MATYEKFSSPIAQIYGIIFQEYHSLFSLRNMLSGFIVFKWRTKNQKQKASPIMCGFAVDARKYPCWLTIGKT